MSGPRMDEPPLVLVDILVGSSTAKESYYPS